MFLCGYVRICMYVYVHMHAHMTLMVLLPTYYLFRISVFFFSILPICITLYHSDILFWTTSWIILFLHPATETRRHNATSSPIGGAHIHKINPVDVVLSLPCTSQRYIVMTSSNGNIFRVTGVCKGNPSVTGGFPHKGQWRGAVMFSLNCAWKNGQTNNRDAGDLIRHRAHYDVTVICQNWVRSIAGSAEGISSTDIGLFST